MLALTACDTTTREARRMVKRAEQLADTLPDSTAHLIDSVLRMPASFSERERMDMALLQAEALFGSTGEVSPIMDDDFFNNKDIISTSPELERAAAYYAKKKLYDKAAHAALYSGFVQQHYNEKEAAMCSFKEAEQYGRLAVDSLTVAQAEYWIGKMLINDGIEQEALESFKISESFIGKRYADRASIENSKAVTYILLSQFDSAELYLRQSFLYAEKGGADKVKRKIYNNYSVLYRLQGKYDQAVTSLRQIMNDPNIDDSERLMLYLNLGKAYFNLKEVDSAANFYQCVEEILSSVNVKKETRTSAYGALSHFAESQNNTSLALHYREKHERLVYDVMIQRQEQTIYRVQQQYDYESLQNVMNRKMIQKQRIITLFGLFIIIGLIVLSVSQFRLAKMRRQEAETKADLSHFMQKNLELEAKQQSHKIQQAALSGRLKRSNEELRELKGQVLQQNDAAQKPEEQAETFADETICRLVMERVEKGQFKSKVDCSQYRDFALNKQQLLDLRLAVDRHFGQFTVRLKNAYPQLTNSDLDYCCLYLLGLTDADVAALMQRAYNTVIERNGKLRKVFGSDKPLPDTLMGLANGVTSI